MPDRQRAAANLVYILGEFPSVSETFILREMLALEEMGFRITPLSCERPEAGPVHAAAEALAHRTLYRPRPLSLFSLLGVLRTAARHPLGLFSALLIVLRQALAHPRCVVELVSALLAACSFAARLSPRVTRHIHAHFATYPTTVGLLLAEICGTGCSFSCHARDIFSAPAALLPWKLREADFVTVCTRYGLERLQRNHSLIVRDKVHLIYHGIDATRLVSRVRVQHPQAIILAVGRLVEKKGLPFLLQAGAMLAGRGMHFELIIAGDGPEREELQRLAGGLGLRDRVIFSGLLSQEELAHVYRRAEVLCVPSIVTADGDRDGLPNVILEAMAYGVPVVASNLPGISEAVVHGETGLLVAPGSPADLAAALERVLTDPALHEDLAGRAKRRVQEDFDLLKNTVRLGALLAGVLGLRHWPPPAVSVSPPET